MPTYSNGDVPYSVVSVVLDSGTDENGYYEFRCSPAFAARWAFAKQYAEGHFGTTIHIRTGWNIYRPLGSQQTARTNACASGNCAGAAVPGYSSHGGNWNGRDCLAVDVDPNGLTWAQVDEAMTAAGFSAGLITASISGISGGEPWHYIDFNAFGPIPAGMNATPFQEDDMFTDDDRKTLTAVQVALGAGGLTPSGINDGDTVLAVLRTIRDSGGLTSDQNNALMSVYKAVFIGGGDGGKVSILAALASLSNSPGGTVDTVALAATLRNGLGADIAADLAKRLAG